MPVFDFILFFFIYILFNRKKKIKQEQKRETSTKKWRQTMHSRFSFLGELLTPTFLFAHLNRLTIRMLHSFHSDLTKTQNYSQLLLKLIIEIKRYIHSIHILYKDTDIFLETKFNSFFLYFWTFVVVFSLSAHFKNR